MGTIDVTDMMSGGLGQSWVRSVPILRLCILLVFKGRLGASSSLSIEIRCVSLVINWIPLIRDRLLCHGLSPPTCERKVWWDPKKYLKFAYQTITNPVPRLAPIPAMNTTRAPYSGSSRKFILALDIGTTFSGAAYVFLDPGQVPEIRPVTR